MCEHVQFLGCSAQVEGGLSAAPGTGTALLMQLSSARRKQGLSLFTAFSQICQIIKEFQEISRKQQRFHIKSRLELERFGSMPSMAVQQMTQRPCSHSLY